MGYTDKELQLATQIAYMDIDAESVRTYWEENGSYPTLKYLLTEYKDKQKIYDRFMDKFSGTPTGNEVIRKQEAKQFLDDIVNDTSKEYANWRIAAVNDDNDNTGMYGCLIETSDHEAIIGFRGSESVNDQQIGKDWIEADFGLLNRTTTKQQELARQFLNDIASSSAYDKYTSFAVTGHSLGGNLAAYATITCNQSMFSRIQNSVSFDGPGFSTEFMEKYKKEIKSRSGILSHYQWSFVGGLLYQIPGSNNVNIYTKDKVYGKNDLNSLLQKHDTCFIEFDENGNIKIGGKEDDFTRSLGDLSRMIDSATSAPLLVDKISEVYQNMPTWGKKVTIAILGELLVGVLITNPQLFYDICIGMLTKGKDFWGEDFLPDLFSRIDFWIDKVSLVDDEINGLKDEIGKLMDQFKSLWDKSLTAISDPLILDLGKDGYDILQKDQGVHFDLDGNGFAEKIGWTGKDGILSLDLNQNQMIDDGSEVFGDKMRLADGTFAKNGFEALAQYDTDGNGIIDANDSIFSKLLVWMDTNADGQTDSGELKSLQELGIKSIQLDYILENKQIGKDEKIGNSATFTFQDGTTSKIAELWVSPDLHDTTQKQLDYISDEVKELPNIQSIGNVHMLQNAMMLDQTGELKELVKGFISSIDSEERSAMLKQILIKLAGAENVSTTSRGTYIDGQKLAVLEAFAGQKFVGTSGSNPNPIAAPTLNSLYDQLETMYYVELLAQSTLAKYVNLIKIVTDENGKKIYSMEVLNEYLYCKIIAGQEKAEILGDLSKYLTYYTENMGDHFQLFYQLKQFFVGKGTQYTDLIDGGVVGALVGDSGNNTLNGSEQDDLIIGRSGNDKLYGGKGNDILDGGKGNDILEGGYGNDVYIINLGDGEDTIIPSIDEKVIRFGEGITSSDLRGVYEGAYDVTLYVGTDGQKITLQGYQLVNSYRKYKFEMSDGRMLTEEDLEEIFRYQVGTEKNDTMNSYYKNVEFQGKGGDDKLQGSMGNDRLWGGSGNDTLQGEDGEDELYGEEGDDRLIGGNGNDILDGGKGNDILEGGNGNDILHGGKGNDILNGGNGNDVYTINLGDGADTIIANTDEKVIRFGEGITAWDIRGVYEGTEDVILYIGTEGQQIKLKGYCYSPNYRNYKFEMSDGNTLTEEELERIFKHQEGTEGNDTMNSYYKNVEFYGKGGNDNLRGSLGNDYLWGGSGNDVLRGDEGDDKLYGDEGDDNLSGEYGDDYLAGGDGNDKLYGGNGNDILDGGKGNDYLEGGYGNDVYIINLGDGEDIIAANKDEKIIRFGEGIAASDIRWEDEGTYDLTLYIGTGGQKITLQSYRLVSAYRNYKFEFANGDLGMLNSDYTSIDLVPANTSNAQSKMIQENAILLSSIYDDNNTADISVSEDDNEISQNAADISKNEYSSYMEQNKASVLINGMSVFTANDTVADSHMAGDLENSSTGQLFISLK